MKATTFLILICIIVYPYGIHNPVLTGYSYDNFFIRQEWWTLVTALFVHGNILHLLGNMVFLFLFGRDLERQIGPARLLLCFLLGGMVSLLASYYFYPHNELIVGASGSISTIIGLLMIYSPWKISFLLNFFPMPLGVAALTYMVMNYLLAHSRNLNHGSSNTAYELHIMGFIIGILFGVMWNPEWKKNLIISIVSFIGFYLILAGVIYYFRFY